MVLPFHVEAFLMSRPTVVRLAIAVKPSFSPKVRVAVSPVAPVIDEM
jgi:hypothetical protein